MRMSCGVKMHPFHDNRLIKRLERLSVPSEYLASLGSGLTAYYKDNRSKLPDLVSALLPTDNLDYQFNFCVSLVYLQWLMFEGDPDPVLDDLATVEGKHGVCGAFWGTGQTGYVCRTCEVDNTSVICVSCFRNGNHDGHDFTIISSNGFCDCGDVNARKREGFCSNHNGVQAQIQPLSEELAKSMEPVLDLLFVHWENSLTLYESLCENGRLPPLSTSKVASAFGIVNAVTRMLLRLFNRSQSLLGFISERMVKSVSLLDVLSRAVRFLKDAFYVRPLLELLLKLLSKQIFANEFAKPFLKNYSTLIRKADEENNDVVHTEEWKLLSTKIFTVPSLTLYLVKERDLLVLLLKCLHDNLVSCVEQNGRLEVNKLANLYMSAVCVLLDIRYVMSHEEVAKYVIRDEGGIIKMWIKLLAFVQGMDINKKVLRRKEKKKFRHMPPALGILISNINSLLLTRGLCESSEEQKVYENYADGDSPRPANVRKLSFSGRSAAGGNSLMDSSSGVSIIDFGSISYEPSVPCLTNECLNAMESWLRTDGMLGNIIETELKALPLLSLPYWPNISDDVRSTCTPVNIPLHRLLSMILQQAVRKCNVECRSSNTVGINSLASLSTSFFGKILRGCHPNGFSSFVMEHPLRLRVFFAQYHAGMVRKTRGLEWYCLHWSRQRVELDLFLLQCCAVLAPADVYVTRILERFGLSTYLDLHKPQSNVYEPFLMQKLLTLLIQIVKERRFCGLSETDSLQREFVRDLAIGDATRNELVKLLPGDLSKIDGLQEVLDRVAIQSDIKKGLYTLRSEYWKELDVFHPYWRRDNLRIVTDRYLHFCKTSAAISQLPKWTKPYEPFNELARIATSKVVQEIIRAVLFYGVNSEKSIPSRATGPTVLAALHLLSLALDICIQQIECSNISANNGLSFPIYALARQEIFMGPADEPEFHSLLSLLGDFNRKKSIEFSEGSGSRRINFPSLVENLLNKFAYIDSKCVNELVPDLVTRVEYLGNSDASVAVHV